MVFDPSKVIKKMIGPRVNVPKIRSTPGLTDLDADGIPNQLDCQPQNIFRQDIVDKCLQLDLAEKQRETELSRNEGLRGTKGYEDMGCYECTGYDKTCKAYYTKRMMDDFFKK